LVLTTLDPKHLDGETILELYRLRWQIEVAIKRCKSILDMDKLRVRKNKELAHVWLLGKLLYVMIIDRRARRRCGYELQRLDKERRQTCWRIWKMLKLEVATIIAGSAFWQERDWKQCIKAMCERRRKPRLQQVSKAVISYLQTRIDINQQPLVEAA
ncbi:MAG TPA: transposase, partial [Blastocatellia bacterium]|nr:transposase [Blastocatellia bacterium]